VISVSDRIKGMSEELAVINREYLGKERILC